MPEQNLVSSIVDVIKNIEIFNKECKEDIEGAKSVVRNCNYYVGFDGQFASVKFAAWQDVNISKYLSYREADNSNFHAKITQKRLNELGIYIINNENVIDQFKLWGNNSGLNVTYDENIKLYTIDNIIPLKVRTTTQKKIIESNPEKGNYELWAPARFANMVPEIKKPFNILIGDKEISVARQFNASDEIIYGTCSGRYSSIRELVFKYNLKLGDIVYLQLIKDSNEYRLLIEEGEADTMSNGDNQNDPESIIDNGIDSFKSFVSSRGYSFSDEVLANYLFSLKAKPFVILSGISGTGKTKIAQLFAEYMCPDEEIEIVQDTSDDEIIYQVPKYFVKYNRIVLQNRIADLIQTQIDSKSSVINVVFDRIKGTCWFGYANSKNKAKQVLFSGEIAKYVKKQIKVGDYIKIYLSYEDERETLVFEKFNPQKKVVKQKSRRYSFISVRPDWTDNKSLLGFYNPILETYQPTELLKLMLRAKEDRQNPYFVILDEMNLAKVEHYFSDFLSCLESRRLDSEGNIISESIILHDEENSIPYEDADGREYMIPNRIDIPLNIYFTGTVNVDETTYMFSPKVLDRANVIEFNEVNMSKYKDVLYSKGLEKSKVNSTVEQDFIEYFTDQGKYNWRLLKKEFNNELGGCYDKLIELNSILYDYHMHFGYRVIDEIMMYLSYGYEYYSSLVEVDLDIQILQKVLPKMHGNRKQLEIPLSRLIRYCFNADHSLKGKPLSIEEKGYVMKYSYDNLIEAQYIEMKDEVFSEPKYIQIKEGVEPIFPRSAKKLVRMYSMLENQGYTSFIE